MNTIGGDVLQAINKAIDLSEKNIKVLLLETKQQISLWVLISE
jgi:hypothetical protein